ncbi:hypothetical protein CPB86DRAFT_511494 [Serendipita vermifera]|nr:hypothetical protein CPB86DRAFT_511494 [Serendipita vermifera]
MCNTVNTYLQGLSNVCSPDWNEDTSEHMVSKYENLIAACKRHESCREIASSPDAVKELQQWHHQGPNDTSLMTLDDILDADFEHFVMPPAEREYRESVSQQTTLAYAVNGWHRTQLSERLDSHQSRIEEVKLLAGRVVSEHSRLSTALVGHLEATKSNIHEFSSSSSISWAHDQCDLESDHLYLKKPVHIDFSNGKRQSHVIFGTISKASLEARCALKALGEKHELSRLYLTNPVKDGALKLERLPTRELESLSVPKLRLLLSFALLSSPPLVPLLEEDIKRYATSGLPRNKMSVVMSRVIRQDEVAAIFNVWEIYHSTIFSSLDKLLTHRATASKIINDIYLKWDFSNRCPFPPDVKRGQKSH